MVEVFKTNVKKKRGKIASPSTCSTVSRTQNKF